MATIREDIETLNLAFSALTNAEIGNLKWHAAHGTPICCGRSAAYFADGVGL